MSHNKRGQAEGNRTLGKLTVPMVKALKDPGKYTDLNGLILRVAPGGSRQWVWRGTVHGRRVDLGLGPVSLTSLAEARDIAFTYRKLSRAGGDPRSLRLGATAPVFAEAVEQVIEAHRGGWKDGGRSEGNWRRSLERYAYPAIGRMPVDQITSADLVRVLLPIWHDKRETARKVKTRIGVVMRWCIAEGYRTDDPAGSALSAALPRHKTPAQHHASLPHREVAAALATVDGTDAWPATKACFRFIVATACRSGEVRLATWDEMDLDARTWTMPAVRSKTGRDHLVPLSPMAVAALDDTRRHADGGPLVFPSPRGKELSNSTMSKLLRENGIAAVPHGFRSSFRSWCAEQGVSREIAEAALAHSAGAVERAYQRSDLLEARRQVMNDWSAYLTS